MAAVSKPTTLGPQTEKTVMRTKVGEFEWGGMWPDGDAASPPDNRFRMLINARLRDGGVVPRAGQTKFNTSVLHSASAIISGLHDFKIASPYSIWLAGDGCPGVAGSAGWFLGSYDVDQNPAFQPNVYYSTATTALLIKAFDQGLFLGQDTVLRRLTQIKAPWGTTVLAIATSGGLDQQILTLPAGFTQIGCLETFDGRLYIGGVRGSGTSAIYTYDGLTEDTDLASIEEPRGFIPYRDNLILGYDGVPNHIRVRAKGAVPGTWATVAPGAGTVRMRGNGCGCSFRDEAWFATGTGSLWRFNGTTLTEVTAAAIGWDANVITHSCFVFNNILYVTYYRVAAPARARLASYNGAAWTVVVKDFITQFPNCTFVGPMVSHRNSLFVGASDGGRGCLYESAQGVTNAAYTKREPAAGNNGQIDQLVVF